MSIGLMESDANYPSDAGLQLDGVAMLGNFQMKRHLASMSIGGVPGTGASYKLQVKLRDDDINAWVDVANSILSGDGADATGNVVVPVIGEAVRIVAVNGSSPGEDDETPVFTLEVFPEYQAVAGDL